MLDIAVLYTLPLLITLVFVKRWRRHSRPYPPGPTGYQILGNVVDLPKNVSIWENLTSLANRHETDILYLRLRGQDTIVLSSNEAISDLIDKRSSIYADRPRSAMMELAGVTERSMAMMPYGDKWRTYRKLCHESLNARMTVNFESHQYKYTHRLLSRLLEAPENLMQELDFLPGAVILSMTYGLDIKPEGDPILNSTLEATRIVAAALVPGKFMVDAIPILRYLPDWFPGTEFKALAKEVREKYKISLESPMEYVKNAMKSGEKFTRSIASDCLSRLEDNETDFDERVICDVSGVMFRGGAGAARAVLQAFFLVMVLNPGVMKKAQEELDRVVGKDRLPDFSDKDNLPYIDAVVKELLRWNPPLPVGFPGRVMQDDVYRGYFIPKGATVMQNIWAICRDPNVYPDPEAFNPERFLENGKINPRIPNPEDRVFGGGRRICPGRRFALRTAYLVVACTLSLFDIGPGVDTDGNPQLPAVEFDNTLARHPKPFKCTIKPRSENAAKLVSEACERIDF